MIVEIINVGSELLLGEIVNTNATYIQKMCKEFGFHVYHQTLVGDNAKRFRECLDIAFKRGADCVITTGGLGPTSDDISKEVAAEYLGLPLYYNEAEAKKVEEKCKFVSGYAKISENNFKQAAFPKDAYILENEIGTANACVMQHHNKIIINLPGPPKELRYVIVHSLKPYLKPFKEAILYTFSYTTMGISESKVAFILEDILDEQQDVSVALYASEETVRIRLACMANSQNEADVKMQATKKRIEERIDDIYIVHENIKDALYHMMPPYTIHYPSSFRLPDWIVFGNKKTKHEEVMQLVIDCKPHKLGEIIDVQVHYKQQDYHFNIPLLKKAELSYTKLESRIMQQLYIFLKQIT
ncbi:MAG: competence/damage-inducible protein A [Breznakia sp.]